MGLGVSDLKLTTTEIPLRQRIIKKLKKKRKKKKIQEAQVIRSSRKVAAMTFGSQRSNMYGRYQKGNNPLESIRRLNTERRQLIRNAIREPGGLTSLETFRKTAPKFKPRLIPKKKSLRAATSLTRQKNLRNSNLRRVLGAPSKRSQPGKTVGGLYQKKPA